MTRNIQKRTCYKCRASYYVDLMKVKNNSTRYCYKCGKRRAEIYVTERDYLAHIKPKKKEIKKDG